MNPTNSVIPIMLKIKGLFDKRFIVSSLFNKLLKLVNSRINSDKPSAKSIDIIVKDIDSPMNWLIREAFSDPSVFLIPTSFALRTARAVAIFI